MWCYLCAIAAAQSVPNGTCDYGVLPPWELVTSAGTLQTYNSPEQGWVMVVERQGAAATTACSGELWVTRDSVRAVMRNEPGMDEDVTWFLGDAAGAPLATGETETPESAGFSAEFLDATAGCGELARVCLSPENGPSATETIQVDEVTLEGDACPQYLDGDYDGFCLGGQDLDGNGDCLLEEEVLAPEHDCDDADAERFPGREEECNRVDDDCDGATDEDLAIVEFWPDEDADGWGDAAAIPGADCAAPEGSVAAGGDCNDGNSSIHPEAEEVAGDSIDQDCDGEDLAEDPSGTAGPGEDRTSASPGDDKPVGCACDGAGGSGAAWALFALLLAGAHGRGSTPARRRA